MLANQDDHTFELSYSNLLVLAYRDAHTLELSYSNQLILPIRTLARLV